MTSKTSKQQVVFTFGGNRKESPRVPQSHRSPAIAVRIVETAV